MKAAHVGLGRAATGLLPSMLAHHVMQFAVADLDKARAQRCAGDLGCTAHRDLDALVADPAIEAVYVATPHECHTSDAVTVAQTGRHLLVEIPVALSLPELRRIVGAADHAGGHLTVGPTHGQTPTTLLLREIVASEEYGRLWMAGTPPTPTSSTGHAAQPSGAPSSAAACCQPAAAPGRHRAHAAWIRRGGIGPRAPRILAGDGLPGRARPALRRSAH